PLPPPPAQRARLPHAARGAPDLGGSTATTKTSGLTCQRRRGEGHPTPIDDWTLSLGETTIEVVEFGAGEAKHHACFHLVGRRAFVAADLIYNGAHLYLQEHNLEGWLARLDEFERFAAENGVQTIYPG